MKIALVFDDLVQYGGAEKLLLAVTEIFPQAPLYTTLATSTWKETFSKSGITLKLSFMQKLPFKKSLNRFYSVLGLHMLAFETFDFSDFDVVLSISSRYAHGILTKPETKHICYLNSPGRMFWEPFDYFKYESPLTRLFSLLVKPFLSHSRIWDYSSAQRVDVFVANSPEPQKRIGKYYGQKAEVIFPPVSAPPNFFNDYDFCSPKACLDYYLVLTRLLPWKRVDIAIEACANLGLNLKIIGNGPDFHRLKKLSKKLKATEKVEFLGYVSEKEKWDYLQNCQAFIMTQKEDFGIAPLEAMLVGKPVIALKKGGALSYIDSHTGAFFDNQTAQSLQEALKSFDPRNFDPEKCKNMAQKFSKAEFQKNILSLVNRIYLEKYTV